ncbi:MAG: hypothetical protein IE886_04860 [Campylobacterales bacterium]|nr:hypothetical protein [Campylobacterales bacterium]
MPAPIPDLIVSMETQIACYEEGRAADVHPYDIAELIRSIEEVDETVAGEVLQNLPASDRETLETLIAYDWEEAGAYMQTELFLAYIDEQIGDSVLLTTVTDIVGFFSFLGLANLILL